MQALKDAAGLLVLGVLLISVRITPLQKVDWIPPAQAAEHVLDAASEAPRPSSVEPQNSGKVFVLSIESEETAEAGCPIRLQTELCQATNDGPTVCVHEPDGHRREDRGTRARQRVAERAAADNVDCT